MADQAERVIQGQSCLRDGADWLCEVEPRFAPVRAALTEIPLRLRPDGFATLMHTIVGQQVSIASAAAIWARLEGAGMITPDAVASASGEDLAALGLSRPKTASTEEVIAKLTAVPGIGLWTAEIYALFALGRADVFPAGDLALQEAAKTLFDLPERPNDKTLRAMAEDWSPWRGVAARLLWAYYRMVKNREGIG